ncbi:hypothetical protein [Kineosporia sp. A_224]|uniref:hypothetical protein n=1 Tax=Kineosporia sp. A_224 TaxID=1962180 RepID=UPI000B4B9AEB|nr:hypothetical protein [Kineosporia sp. A_224]
MDEIVVEIWVPLVRTTTEGYPFPWIEDVEAFLEELDQAEVFDDGEEIGEHYVFFVSGADEDVLLAVAGRVAALPGVPGGVHAIVTSADAPGFGQGRKVSLTP